MKTLFKISVCVILSSLTLACADKYESTVHVHNPPPPPSTQTPANEEPATEESAPTPPPTPEAPAAPAAPSADSTPESPDEFVGLSTVEILKRKYKKADFVCRLWNQAGSELDLTQTPAHVVTKNLLEEENIEDFTIEALDDEDQLFIMRLHVQSVNHEVSLNYSPVIEVKYNYWLKFNMGEEGYRTDSNGSHLAGTGMFYENQSENLFSVEMNVNSDTFKRFSKVQCEIQTQAHSAPH